MEEDVQINKGPYQIIGKEHDDMWKFYDKKGRLVCTRPMLTRLQAMDAAEIIIESYEHAYKFGKNDLKREAQALLTVR